MDRRGTTAGALVRGALSGGVFFSFFLLLSLIEASAQQRIPVPVNRGAGYTVPQMIMNFVNFVYTTVGPPAAIAATAVAIPMCGSRHWRKAGLCTLGGVGFFASLPWITDQIGTLTGWW